MIKKFSYAIECEQAGNFFKFTCKIGNSKKPLTIYEKTLAQFGTCHKKIKSFALRYTAMWNAAIGKVTMSSMTAVNYIPSMILLSNLPSGRNSILIFQLATWHPKEYLMDNYRKCHLANPRNFMWTTVIAVRILTGPISSE